MARTRYLTNEELDSLRAALREKFRMRNRHLKEIPATTYKEAYDDLQRDVLSVSPAAEQSVSLNRLRKLFYYTDSAACPPEHLENANFGKDFLDALDAYLDARSRPKEVLNPRTRRIVLVAVLGAVSISGMLWATFYPRTDWTENFDDTDARRLDSEGWKILDPDTGYWRRQLRPGALTLYTLPGDYWVKPSEPRRISNLLIHPLSGKNFEVSTRLIEFFPYENHQQAALFLFDKHKSREEHLRVNYSFGGPYASNAGDKTPLPGNYEVGTIEMRRNGDVFNLPRVVASVPAGGRPAEMDTVYLKLAVRGKHCEVYLKHPYSWREYRLLTSVELDFFPAYVGLGAFQGWTRDDGTPKGADTMPVFFDWIRVEGRE